MSDTNVLNSTEKLLNQIRSQPSEKVDMPYETSKTGQTLSLKNIKKSSATAGIFIHDGHINLAITAQRKAGSDKELLQWSQVPVPEDLDIDSKRFPAFLRDNIQNFLSSFKKIPIWTAIDTKDLKFRSLVVPDLPESKIPNAALWSFKKEFEIDEDEELFDFQILDNIVVNDIKKKSLIAFTGQKKSIQFLKSLFKKAGFPLTGITATPFAFQNFLTTKTVFQDDYPFVLVNISQDHSDVFCFTDPHVKLVRNIRTGASSLVEDFLEPEQEENTIAESAAEILSSGFELNSPEFERMKEPAERLVSKIVRTGDYCSVNIAENKPIAAYLFYGETDSCKAFMEFAGSRIPAQIDLFQPFAKNDSTVFEIQLPSGAKERSGLIPACAIALSSNESTPNFLFTFKHKAIQARYAGLNKMIAGGAAACLLICAVCWVWLSGIEKDQQTLQSALANSLSRYNPRVTQPLLTNTIETARKKSNMVKLYLDNYLPLGVVKEICMLTPSEVSLISLNAVFVQQDDKTLPGDPKKKGNKKQVKIKGVVNTGFTSLETALTGYVLKLDDSPLFKTVIVINKDIVTVQEKNSLKFEAVMEMM